ncbi:gluconokinase [Sphingobium xenophagum]|uniref:gluconokinase n=1 Tax=Sphingobium xenophagum TaxID=121428 RepID=UPI00037B249C|nr:gluconokinase [Sphingobium xenophagum]
MGVSGSGKSTFGKLLADSLGCQFLEGDEFHDVAAVEKMRAGRALDDADRWPWLDRLGRALGDAAAADGCAIAACSALRRTYRDRLAAASGGRTRFVLLDNDREELARRLSHRTGHYMPASLLDSQFDTLERPEPDEPVLTLNSNRAPEALCEDAAAWLSRVGTEASVGGRAA